MRYDLEGREAKELAPGVAGYALSADGEKLLYNSGDQWTIADATRAKGRRSTSPACA